MARNTRKSGKRSANGRSSAVRQNSTTQSSRSLRFGFGGKRSGPSAVRVTAEATARRGVMKSVMPLFWSCLILAAVLYLFVCMGSWVASDPGWDNANNPARIHNFGGHFGALIASFLFHFMGHAASWALPMLLGLRTLRRLGWRREQRPSGLTRRLFVICCGAVTLFSLSVIENLRAFNYGEGVKAGGIIGEQGGKLLRPLLTAPDSIVAATSTMALLIVLLAAFTIAARFPWLRLMDRIGAVLWVVLPLLNLRRKKRKPAAATATATTAAIDDEEYADGNDEPQIAPREPRMGETLHSLPPEREPPPQDATRIEPTIHTPSQVAPPPPAHDKPTPALTPSPSATRPARVRRLPSLDLLDKPEKAEAGYSDEDLKVMSRLLEERLGEFGIEVRVVAVHPGPVITRFEIDPAPGIKVSQITNLARDLARSLSVVSLRVVENIPGKTTIGIEIPNRTRELVTLHEGLSSRPYAQSKSPLTLMLGKDISGRPVVANLQSMPHLLVAGATGSGKSVCINALILSILYKALPEQVRLIMVDPKILELAVYDDIPHLLAPVVTDMKQAGNVLRWSITEMERRYRTMAALGVRNITNYNDKVEKANAAREPIADPLATVAEGESPPTLESMPYIVIVIDELADLMMVAGKKMEELITRIAQRARAAGIHLLLATQRPSVDVVTGLIKANVPARIAFNMASRVDSRTVLDQMGAEQLLGHGDMLFLSGGSSMLDRVHGSFVSDQEVHRVVEALKQQGPPDYNQSVLEEPQEGGKAGAGAAGNGGGEDDELYDQALQIVTETRRPSISLIQRHLRIGYNRAARLIETMEKAGAIGPMQENGKREVLAPPPPPSSPPK